jgi:hypothetical protein
MVNINYHTWEQEKTGEVSISTLPRFCIERTRLRGAFLQSVACGFGILLVFDSGSGFGLLVGPEFDDMKFFVVRPQGYSRSFHD